MQSVPANMPSGKYTYELGGVFGSSSEYRAGVVGVVSLQAGSSGGTITGGKTISTWRAATIMETEPLRPTPA